jgi:hypothetical protein
MQQEKIDRCKLLREGFILKLAAGLNRVQTEGPFYLLFVC